MKLLLDSHFLVWWPLGSRRVGSKANQLICDGGTELFASAASWWELGIKRALGRLNLEFEATRQALAIRGVTMLPVSFEHAEASAALPAIHGDPFDRMLVAQATAEGLKLLTRDAQLRPYGSAVLYV